MNTKLKSIITRVIALALTFITGSALADVPSDVKYLVNFTGNAQTPELAGWIRYNQTGVGGSITVTASSSGVQFKTAGGGNFFDQSNPTTDFANGSFADVNGGVHTTVAEEVKASLGLDSTVVFDSTVYMSGLMNGGAGGHTATISGLTAGNEYLIYAGFGRYKTDADQRVGFTLPSSGVSSIGSLEYVASEAGQNMTVSQNYQSFSTGTAIKGGRTGVFIVRLNHVVPKNDGTIQFNMSGERGSINFLAVKELTPPVPPAVSTVSADISWSKIGWDVTIENPATTELELTVQNNATITLDGEFAYKAITINGNVRFVVPDSAYEDGCWEKQLLKATTFTASGTVMFGAIKEGFYGAFTQTANGISLRAQNKEVISINIAGGKAGDSGAESEAANLVTGDGFYGIAPTLGSSWNNINRRWQDGGNQTIEITAPYAYDGNTTILRDTMSLSATGKNTWNCDSIANPFLRGYLDDGNGVTVEVHGVPYTKYDVIVYATSDDASIALAPITINGTQYTFKNGETQEGSEVWGVGQYATPEIGKNALRVNGCSGDTVTINAVRTGGRATLCAVQVINKGEVVLKEEFSATIDSSTSFSAINWDGGKTFKEGQLNMATITVADGEGEVELTFNKPDMVLAKLTIISSRDIKLTATEALSKIPQFDVSGCTGKITYAYPVAKLSTAANGVTYAADSGSDDAPAQMDFRVQEGSMTLKDATFYLGSTAGSVTSTVDFVDAKIYAKDNMGFAVGMADFVLWGETKVEAERVILSEGADGRVASLTLNDSSEIVVTGSTITNSNQSSIMFGHWNGPSTFTMNDDAKFTAENAQVLVGKTSNNQTITINGGIFTAKGIKAASDARGTNALNLNGGELILGEYGIGSYGSTTIAVTVLDSTKITSTAAMSITQPVEIDTGITLTLDATNGDIMLMGDVQNSGTIKVVGGTVTIMQNANDGNIVTEGDGKVIYGYTVNINNCGKFAIPEGKTAADVRLYNADGSEVEIIDSDNNYVYYEWQYTGSACLWDYEFNQASGQAPVNEGTDKTNLSLDGNRPDVIKTGGEYATNEVTGAISLRVPARPWRDVSNWPTAATFMFYGKMVGTDKAYQLAFGSKNNSGNQLFIATKSVADGTVDLCFSVNGAAPTVLCTMNVPNAQTANHLYAIVLKDDVNGNTVVNTYLDGKLLQPYTHTGKLTLGGGFQIASGHGGVVAGGYSRPADTDPATMDWLRVYDVELNAEAMMSLAEIYKYVSTNGEASRTVTAADTAWTETGKWMQQSFEGAVEEQDAPNADTVVKLTVDEDATLTLNLAEKANYEALEIKGTGTLTLTGAQDAVVPSVSGATTIGTDVKVAYDAIAFGNVTLADNTTLTFDFSTLDLTKEFSSRTIRLTGASILGDGAKVEAVGIAQSDNRSAVFSYDASSQQYSLVITVDDTIPFVYENGAWTWGTQVLTEDDLINNPTVTRSIKSDYAAALGAYNYSVEDGATLKQTDASATGVITVNAGGTFDINGVIDTSLKVVLNGGSLVNTGSAVPVSKKQYVSLSQTASSFIGGLNELAYVCSQYAANTFDLSGATLTKKDGNTFTLRTSTITSGTIAVTEGTLVLDRCTIAADATVTVDVAAGATVEIKGSFTKTGTLNLTGAGTIIWDGMLPAFDGKDGWTGVVWIKNVSTTPSNGYEFASYANTNSVVRLTNVKGWLRLDYSQGTVDLVDGPNGELAFEVNDSSGNYYGKFEKLTGTGTIKYATVAQTTAALYVMDVSEFTGTLASANGTGTTARPIYIGSDTGAKTTASLVNIANGATIGCTLQAENVVFGKTVTIKGVVGDIVAWGLTSEPTLPAKVKLVDADGKETIGRLVYNSEDGMITIASGFGFLIMLK